MATPLNFDTRFAAALHDVMRLEPALTTELASSVDPKQALERITAAAHRHNVALAEEDLRDFLAFSTEQAQIRTVIDDLISADPSLADTLAEIQDIDRAVHAIIAAARSRGVTVDPALLAAHLECIGTSNASRELDDEALADVAGGAGLMVGALAILASIGAIGGQVAGFVTLGLIFKKLRK